MKQVKQLLRYPVVLVFFLFLFGYTLFDLTQTDREYSEFENKYLAQKPPFTMKAFLNNEWTQDYGVHQRPVYTPGRLDHTEIDL